jgi:hypothetical protein
MAKSDLANASPSAGVGLATYAAKWMLLIFLTLIHTRKTLLLLPAAGANLHQKHTFA